MALSGSFYNYPVSSFGLYCEWTASQSITGNYSVVTLYTYLSYYTIEVGARNDGTSYINGSGMTFSTPAITDYSSGWKKRLINTQTVTVYHNSDGTKSCDISASWRFSGSYSGVSIGTITASTNITLNTIDRAAPSVSLSTSNITASGVTISTTASTTCDTWQYSLDGGSSWTTFNSSSGTSKSYSITGLTPNTTYNVRVRARKASNYVYGYSSTISIKTLGGSVLSSVSTVTADAATVNIYISVTVYNSSYTHTLTIKNGSSTVLTISGLSLSNGSNTVTLTSTQRNNLLSAMANIKSFTGTFTLTTYSGGSQIGTASQKTAIIQTTAANSTPTFTGFTYSDTNSISFAVTGDPQILIQGISYLRVIASTATAKNGASISSYSVTAGEKVASSASTTLNVGAINTTGTVPVTVTVIDSRGYTASATTNITVIPYSGIEIATATMRRVNEVENTTQIEVSGNISPVTIGIVNKNAFQLMRYRYKLTSDSSYNSWITITPTYTDTSFEYENEEFISLNADYSYNVQIIVSDKLTTDTVTLTIPQGTPLLSFRRKMVGVNNRNPQSAIDVNGEIMMNGFNLLGYVRQLAATGENFNDLIDGGIYSYYLLPLETVCENAPSNHGNLLVIPGYTITQIFFSTDNEIFIRTRGISGNWTAWTQK